MLDWVDVQLQHLSLLADVLLVQQAHSMLCYFVSGLLILTAQVWLGISGGGGGALCVQT
jgi:hypothetical protein